MADSKGGVVGEGVLSPHPPAMGFYLGSAVSFPSGIWGEAAVANAFWA